jgi:hypothetical protein
VRLAADEVLTDVENPTGVLVPYRLLYPEEMDMLQRILLGLLCLLLSACGSGGSGGSGGSSVADSPITGFAYAYDLMILVCGQPVFANPPLVSGGIPTQFEIILGQLPPGISFNSNTGEFSGTPTGLPETVSLTIEVSNSVSQDQTVIEIEIETADICVPDYPESYMEGILGVDFSVAPQSSCGLYEISPSLPSNVGISFDSATGEISGIPVQEYSEDHTISVSNCAGGWADTITLDCGGLQSRDELSARSSIRDQSGSVGCDAGAQWCHRTCLLVPADRAG